MPYTIRLPDGKLVENIPDEITPQEAKQRIIKAFPQYAPPESAFRQVADIPLQIGRGAVSGVRMIADAFGADNPASEALRGAEDYIGSLLSAQAKKDQQEIARILKDAEDKGVLDQVKAGFQALTVAPIDTLSQFLGTAAPTIVTGLGGAMLKLGATGIGAMQAGTGAAMGAGLAKGNIYEVVKDELVKSGIDEKTAEDRARQAQEYGGENLDQILLSAGLGGVAALGPLERIFARAPAIPADVAAKNMFGRAVQGGIIEGTPEAAQAFQEQVAQNIALQREGFDVPTFRGAVANATLEGLAGFGIGAPIGMFSKPPTPEAAVAETPPGAEPPLALPPPSPPEGPTGPGGPPGLPQLGGPSPTLPLLPGMAPSQFIVGDQMVRPQEQPEPIVRGPEEQPPTAIEEPTPPTEPPPTAPAAEPVDEIAVLNDQLKMIEMKRMDPTLSPNDPIFEQLDAREQKIRRKLLSLSGSPEPLDKATTPAPVITPPVTPPAAVAPVTPPAAPPAAPPVTPPVITPPVITTGELPEGRDPKEIKAEINRVRQSLQRTQTAVKKGQLPESDIPRLETRISNLEQELEQAKSLPKQVKYRNKEGKTWSGKGDYPPWLRASISQGFDLSEFEVLPELGNRSEDEVGFEAERPPGFGSPVPPTRIPAEMEETIAETERVRKASPNLFSVLRGRVTPQDVNDISPDTSMRLLKAKEGAGRDVSDLVEDGVLDDFLPYELRTDSGMFDPYVATEYIKDLLRQNPVDNPEARLSYDARVELNSLGIKLSELEQELEPEDVNRELQAIAAEERAVAQEAEADVLKEPQRGPVVPTGPPEFALQGETLEEAKARTERAEADREAFERKRAADLEREVFRLQPTPSAPAPTVTTGDLFGAAGMADQPARKPAAVAAEPTPIEAEATKAGEIDQEAVKNTIDAYVGEMRRGSSDWAPTQYNEDTNTLVYIERWQSDLKIPREEFDELVAGAVRSDTSQGAKYSILVKDTPTEYLKLIFQPRGLKPTQKYVEVFMAMEEVTTETPERTYKEEVEFRLNNKKLNDPDISKKIQEARGVSKPVADAYVRALKNEAVALANWSYGKGTEEQFAAASKETQSIENRIQGIEKRTKGPEPKVEQGYEIRRNESFRGRTTAEISYSVLKDGKLVQTYDRKKDAQQYVDMMTLPKEEVFKKYPELKPPEQKEPEVKKEKARPNFYKELLPKAGFTRLDIDDPRTYKNKGGESFLTFERDGVRVAFESGNILYADDKGRVGRYFGDEPDSIFAALIVDQKDRKQGKARKALQEIVRMADESNTNLYLEPASLDTEGMTTPQLKEFYRQFGFEPQTAPPATDRVMIRKHGAEMKVQPKKEEKPKDEVQTRTVYRTGSSFMGDLGPNVTAADVIRYEQEELGNQDLRVVTDVDLSKIPTSKLEWVTFDRKDAEQYLPEDVDPEDKTEISSRKETFRILAQDSNGGYLIERVPAAEAKPQAKKEPSAGPTFAGMQAEIERIKAEAKAMGIELNQQTFVRDTAEEKEKAAKKEAKKQKLLIKQATRNEIEYARFDDVATDPIQATPEQLKLAKELADKVNGELVFYDKDLNLGLVTVSNDMGFDDYFPIHDGIISKVDVSDYTGLSVIDKSFLKRIKNSLEILRGASGRMLKGTEEQQKGILAVAKTLGGTPVYFDPDTNVGLVRGYGDITGRPIYSMTMGDRYSTADVEQSTVAAFAPYKAKLIELKKRLEKEAEEKHKDNPFIKFENGIAMSDGIDPAFRAIITEWKSMLGLGNVNIYISTIGDATKNRENFTGPHRVVGSGTLSAYEAGSMRRMDDGSYYVLFSQSTSKTSMLETIAHELGHVHEREVYRNASQDLKDKLKDAHAKWVEKRKGKTAREAINMLRAKTSAQTTKLYEARAEELRPYWSSFSEWYADQVSRWAVTDEKPVGVVEKFFARLAAALRRFYQTLKGQGYLPDETFVEYLNQVTPKIVETIPGPIKEPVQLEMSFQMQKDLFGSTEEAKDIERVMEVKGKKLPPGRSPELAAAAQAVQAGTMSAEEYNKLVDIYKPIPLYAEPLRPATSEQVFDALDVKKREQINPQIPNGTKVGLRLDIPAFNRKGIFVVSIHQKRTASAPGKVIGYGSVAKAKNVTFGVGNQLKALEIAAGAAKDALQTIEGEYVNISPEQAYAEAQRAIKDPSYVQVGIDPTRHAYFYDRRTTLPIVGAEEVVQIGNMILAKNPVFGKKADFLYNIDGGPINNPLEAGAKRDNEVKETIQDLRNIRREKMVLPSKVRDYGSAAESQRILSSLNVLEQEMNDDLNSQKYDGYTAENFMRQARKSYDDGSISADVFAVIQAVYMENPRLLDGLRLDIKQKFSPKEIAQRTAEGKKSPIGAFQPFERLVNLYTGTKGVVDPETIRHELTHTLEQLMTPAQKKAVVNSYIAALKKAARKHKDARSQEFFDKVIKFLDFPTKENHEAMNNALPSMDFYQYTNPSEYWAVNAEKLMAQRLGNSWDRFKKSVRKMFEKMKDIFGFDNRYAVYDVFDKVMSGSRERMDNRMLTAFIQSSNQNYDFLQNIADDADLIKKYNRSDTPMLDTAPMKRLMIDAVQFSKDAFTEMVNSPTEALRMTFNSLNRGVMYLRNKNIWFGSGLNEADRIKYNGQVRTANGLATASLALDNMLRGGNIATQALFLGGIEYNPNTLTFTAVRKEKNMTKVYEAEAAIKKRIGEQLGTNIIQGYLEAKRSRSIKDEVIARTPKVERLKQDYETRAAALKKMEADPKAKVTDVNRLRREVKQISRELKDAQEDLDNIKAIAKDKVTMSDAEIADFISREQVHPELKEIMDNFNAVNQNMLKFWRQVGLLSQSRYETLAGIKDYVPWYRIMNDEEDVHSPLQATTRSATNIGREKIFKSGKPSVINDFIIEENQDLFKIQPGRINMVKLNGKRLTDKDFTVTPQGEVRLTVPYKPGDVLVIQTQREIENMIDNMTRNVMRMTMNGLRQYAAQRIVSEYATRGADGKIMTFPTVDRERGRFDFISEGRRVVVEIQDPLIAEAALGMETVGMQMWKPLAAAANFTRRTITLSPVFQLKQVFKDAPTAALVTGVKNPAALIGGVYKGFIDAVRDSDPAASILRSAGIGGFYSPARTPEADVKRRIGIINNNTFDYVMKGLDHWGDSSDMAQRIATYNRVMAETGDEALAMYQAANVINFLRHGSGQLSQALVKTVPFLNAYAQSIDVLYNALVGGGLRGLDRKKALQRLAFTGSLLAGTTLLYAMLVGDDDDYLKMDDQSKVRSYMIPGTDVVLPMNTSAGFFFKAIPELIYNKVVNEGTENEMDERRLRRAMKEAAIDMLLGPTPIPSAVKPFIEISLDYNFFTSRSITPRGMENLDAYQQYDMRTSEAAKLLSGLTGTTENRLLNPMDADHLIRSLFGTAGAMAAWSSNLIGQGSEYRPEMGLKDMPITGAFLRQEVPRGREDLFYTLKESTDRKYRTLNRLIERDNMAEADAYLEKYPNLIAYYDYTSEVDTSLKEINAAIRYIGETQDPSYTPDRKREEIRELLEMKNDILEGVEMFRKEAYAD